MKNLIYLALVSLALGCASGKMGAIDKPLESGAISKKTPIFVMPVSTDNMRFYGDKADEKERTENERATIQNRFGGMIVAALSKMGYKAQTTDKPTKKGVLVKGNVTKFDHGSGAARAFVGMGAGSSNMFTDFEVVDMKTKNILTKFEVIATSGGRGGLSATGSFMEAHLVDGSEKVADYLSGKEK